MNYAEIKINVNKSVSFVPEQFTPVWGGCTRGHQSQCPLTGVTFGHCPAEVTATSTPGTGSFGSEYWFDVTPELYGRCNYSYQRMRVCRAAVIPGGSAGGVL